LPLTAQAAVVVAVAELTVAVEQETVQVVVAVSV
jgi:hypothetical protein